jgi:hypothetical protein
MQQEPHRTGDYRLQTAVCQSGPVSGATVSVLTGRLLRLHWQGALEQVASLTPT